MATPRWWLRPGELAWTGNVSGLWRLFYEGDDGDLWSFSIRNGDRGPSYRFRFDYRAPELISDGTDRQILTVLGAVHQPIKRRIGMLVQPGSLHRRILDEIARQLSNDHWVDGVVIRSELRPIPKETTAQALKELIPRYVAQHPHSDLYGPTDAYTLTLAGALESNRTTEVARAIEAALAILKEKFDDDPTFRECSVSEVVARLGLPATSLLFVRHVLTLSGLTFGGRNQGEDFIFGRPKDIEDLSVLSDFTQFLAYLRTGKSDRPSPSAPLILPDDRVDLALPEPPQVVPPALAPGQECRLVTKIWKDPVWSKVIAAGIIAASSAAYFLFRHRLGL